ncbi:MAG: hypothetical protein WDA60_15390 [Acidimicrobiia bacterium]
MLTRTNGGLPVITALVAVVATLVTTVVVAAPVGASVVRKGGSGTPRWLGSRTTDDGVTVRVTVAPINMGSPVINGVALPASCFPDEQVVVGVSTDRIAESIDAQFRTGNDDETQVVAPTAGLSVPYRGRSVPTAQVVVVRTPKGAARVEARTADWRDETDVTGRYAVFARKASINPEAPQSSKHRIVRVKVSNRAGKVIGHSAAFLGRGQGSFYDATRAECRPPSSGGSSSSVGSSSSGSGTQVVLASPTPAPLPDAVGPPPADEAAAHDAVVAAVEGSYAAGGSGEASLTHVEGGDSAAVRAAQELAASRNPQYRGKVTASVTEVKFLDDKEAAVRFDLLADGTSLVPGRVGFVVLTADGWKFSRSSYCALLSSGGGQC